MGSKFSQLYGKKKRKERGAKKEGRKGRKIMVFLEVTKPTLVRPFLAKEFSLFFLFILIGG